MEDNFFEQEEADGQFSVSLQELINAFELEKVYYPDSGEDILVYSSDVAGRVFSFRRNITVFSITSAFKLSAWPNTAI